MVDMKGVKIDHTHTHTRAFWHLVELAVVRLLDSAHTLHCGPRKDFAKKLISMGENSSNTLTVNLGSQLFLDVSDG